MAKQFAKIFIPQAIKMQNGRENPSLPLDEFVQNFSTHSVSNQVSDIEEAKKCELAYLRQTLLRYDLENGHDDLLPEGQDTYYGKMELRHRKFLDDKEDDDDLCLPSRCADILMQFFKLWLPDTERTYTKDLAEMRRLVGEFTQCEE